MTGEQPPGTTSTSSSLIPKCIRLFARGGAPAEPLVGKFAFSPPQSDGPARASASLARKIRLALRLDSEKWMDLKKNCRSHLKPPLEKTLRIPPHRKFAGPSRNLWRKNAGHVPHTDARPRNCTKPRCVFGPAAAPSRASLPTQQELPHPAQSRSLNYQHAPLPFFPCGNCSVENYPRAADKTNKRKSIFASVPRKMRARPSNPSAIEAAEQAGPSITNEHQGRRTAHQFQPQRFSCNY